MRFDPKLIRPDDVPVDDGGEPQVPDDLAALAQQLHDDAQHLSGVYPPARAPQAKVRSLRMSWSVAAFIATGIAAALVIAVALWNEPAQHSQMEASPAQPQAAVVSAASSVTTTVSLSELSPPELEAVLDVLEQDNTRPVTVSF